MSSTQDSILLLSVREEKLPKLLEKLGYQVVVYENTTALSHLLSTRVFDALVLDARGEPEFLDMLEHIRKETASRRIPVILLCADKQQAEAVAEQKYERIDTIIAPVGLGVITSKIATQLRLTKIEGAESPNVSLAEMNATLRDFTARFRKELDEARAIQQSLLPKELPKGDTFECAAHYQPLEEVGGDWYFAQKLPSGNIMLQVADVTGHGLSAAFIGSMGKLAMTAAAKEAPHELLEAMNALMAPQLPEGRFVTMLSVVFAPATGKVQCARAGHPPAILYSPKRQTITQLKGQGFALGFFAEGKYQMIEETMESGDILVLYTDGISEAQNRSLENFGIERIGTIVKGTAPGATAQQVLDVILGEFTRFCDGRLLKDDVTAVVLKRL